MVTFFLKFFFNKYPIISHRSTPMPKMRLGWYAGVSIAVVGELVEAIWSYSRSLWTNANLLPHRPRRPSRVVLSSRLSIRGLTFTRQWYISLRATFVCWYVIPRDPRTGVYCMQNAELVISRSWSTFPSLSIAASFTVLHGCSLALSAPSKSSN